MFAIMIIVNIKIKGNAIMNIYEVCNPCDPVEVQNANVCLKKNKWWSPRGRVTRSGWWFSRLIVVCLMNIMLQVIRVESAQLSKKFESLDDQIELVGEKTSSTNYKLASQKAEYVTTDDYVASTEDFEKDNSTGTFVGMTVVLVILIISMLYISIIFDIKRFHDRDMSGCWALPAYLLCFIPFLGGFVWLAYYIFLGFLDGTHGSNRYGEDPKHRIK
jgi:uncharacterized membrane protein YhaH (DUF805 family)